jgi:hypothetical protein
MGEQTGSRILQELWSYVTADYRSRIMKGHSEVTVGMCICMFRLLRPYDSVEASLTGYTEYAAGIQD